MLPPANLRSSSFSVLLFLPLHAVHGILMAKILKWFAIPLDSLGLDWSVIIFTTRPTILLNYVSEPVNAKMDVT